MSRLRLLGWLGTALLLGGCATSNHGTFVTSTYVTPGEKENAQPAGLVTGESRQSWILYLFPIGDAPSTHEAIEDAKSKIDGTKFLTDLSVDNRIDWRIGYSESVVHVEATAYK